MINEERALVHLRSFQEFLLEVAIASESADALMPEEKVQLRRSKELVGHAVDELIKLIAKLPYDHLREHGYTELWSAIGHAYMIAQLAVRSPALGRMFDELTRKFEESEQERLSRQAAKGREAKAKKDKLRKEAQLEAIRPELASYDGLGIDKTVEGIFQPVNDRLKGQKPPKTISRPTLRRRLVEIRRS
jgi:hypothetical protein